MDRDGQRLGIGRTAGQGPARDGGDVPHVAGHVPDHLQGRRRAPERQSDGHPAEHAALRDELSGHRGLHRLAADNFCYTLTINLPFTIIRQCIHQNLIIII